MEWFGDKFDPWLPKSPEVPKLPKPLDPADFEEESKRYLASLEDKVARLKSRNSEPTSKEIIQSLSAAKEAQMTALVRGSQSPYISNHEYSGGGEDESRLAALQRRLHPEKTAVSPEELDVLVENDLLKAVEENYGSQASSSQTANAPDATQPSSSQTESPKPSNTQDSPEKEEDEEKLES